MKRLLFAAATLTLMASVSMAVPACFTPDLGIIQGMGHTWDGVGTISSRHVQNDAGTAMRFSAKMAWGTTPVSSGFASMRWGYSSPPPTISDLSAYSGYSLKFVNTDNSNWLVNLYMTTGWTATPYGEPSNFYENGWIELTSGQEATLTLDFAALSVVNEDHVSEIGFQVGGNVGAHTIALCNPSNPDIYFIDVSPIPEPVTFVILGLGSVGLLRLRKKS